MSASFERPPDPMYCRNCGYDLGGLTSGAGPECGRTFHPRAPRTFDPRPHARRTRRVQRIFVIINSIVMLLASAFSAGLAFLLVLIWILSIRPSGGPPLWLALAAVVFFSTAMVGFGYAGHLKREGP